MSVELQAATAALREHFGGRLEEGYDEGRRLVAAVLAERFGLATENAVELVRTLEHVQAVRWRDETPGLATFPHSRTPLGEVLNPSEEGGSPTHAGLPFTAGYWRIGDP
jgi:hypothetical protein